MARGLDVRTQLGKLLSDAAQASGKTDTNIAGSFKGFTD